MFELADVILYQMHHMARPLRDLWDQTGDLWLVRKICKPSSYISRASYYLFLLLIITRFAAPSVFDSNYTLDCRLYLLDRIMSTYRYAVSSSDLTSPPYDYMLGTLRISQP